MDQQNSLGKIGTIMVLQELRISQTTKAVKFDSSSWFVDEPKVKCKCCKNTTCYLWETRNSILNNNRHNILFLEKYYIEDNVTNITLHKFHGHNTAHNTKVCLSPTGCYTLYDLHKTKLDYDLNYSESNKTLSMHDSCGAVDVCSISFDIDHPKCKGLNHLTQIVISDMSKLDDPESLKT